MIRFSDTGTSWRTISLRGGSVGASSSFVGSLLLCLLLSSCINPDNTRFPNWMTYGPEYERREAEIHDPYPSVSLGPETGFRPNEFAIQRPEPTRARHQWFSTLMRFNYRQQQNGLPGAEWTPSQMAPNVHVVPSQMMPIAPYTPTVPSGPVYRAGPTAGTPYWMNVPPYAVTPAQPILVQPGIPHSIQ